MIVQILITWGGMQARREESGPANAKSEGGAGLRPASGGSGTFQVLIQALNHFILATRWNYI